MTSQHTLFKWIFLKREANNDVTISKKGMAIYYFTVYFDKERGARLINNDVAVQSIKMVRLLMRPQFISVKG